MDRGSARPVYPRRIGGPCAAGSSACSTLHTSGDSKGGRAGGAGATGSGGVAIWLPW
jgi:hypothetical protein